MVAKASGGDTKLTKGRKRKRKTEVAKGPELIDQRLTKALAHPLRVQILAVANQRRISPAEYAREFKYPLSTVSYHFRELENFDCIELVETRAVRGAVEHFYRGYRRGLVADADWNQLGPAVQAGMRVAGLQDFVGRASQAIMAGTFDAREDAHFSWTAIVLDEQGWMEMVQALEETFNKVMDIEVGASKRIAKTGDDPIPATFALAGFESPKEVERRKGR